MIPESFNVPSPGTILDGYKLLTETRKGRAAKSRAF